MDIEQVEQNCCVCGCIWWLPTTYDTYLRKNHKTYYCPQGHRLWHPEKTDAEKCQENLKQIRENLRACIETKESLRRSNSARKGVITRMKTKAKK